MRYAIVDRDKVLEKDRELAKLTEELRVVRSSLQRDIAQHTRDEFHLNEQLKQSISLGAEKQREIAALRAQLTDLTARLQKQIDDAADERHKLMDAYARGFGAVPIFAEPPKYVPEPEPAKPAVTGNEVPTSDVTDAIKTAGMRARSIVKHIERKKTDEFNEAMVGVRKLFDGDKAEAEATVIAAREA